MEFEELAATAKQKDDDRRRAEMDVSFDFRFNALRVLFDVWFGVATETVARFNGCVAEWKPKTAALDFGDYALAERVDSSGKVAGMEVFIRCWNCLELISEGLITEPKELHGTLFHNHVHTCVCGKDIHRGKGKDCGGTRLHDAVTVDDTNRLKISRSKSGWCSKIMGCLR